MCVWCMNVYLCAWVHTHVYAGVYIHAGWLLSLYLLLIWISQPFSAMLVVSDPQWSFCLYPISPKHGVTDTNMDISRFFGLVGWFVLFFFCLSLKVFPLLSSECQGWWLLCTFHSFWSPRALWCTYLAGNADLSLLWLVATMLTRHSSFSPARWQKAFLFQIRTTTVDGSVPILMMGQWSDLVKFSKWIKSPCET